jgi:hypothetical protein
MLESGLKFQFDKRCFHRLLKLQKKKSNIISLDGRDFYFALEEICLISPEVVRVIQKNHTRFILFSERSSDHDQLIQAMEAIQTLFTNKVEIEINQENEQSFSVLAEKFNSEILRRVVSSFTQDRIRRYSLSFEILSHISLNIFHNFTLVVNKILFRTNLSCLCCISNVIMNAFLQQPNLSTFQIEITHKQENEVVNCISSLINFISGRAFSFEGFSPEVFFHIVDQLEIIGFEHILLQLYPIPTKFNESMSFLQFKFAPSLQIHFQKAVEIVSSKFYKFNLTNIPPFSIIVFEHILSSSKLKIINETTLFQIILGKNKTDSNYSCLMKYVHFAFVKPDLLINFFSERDLLNLDLSVFKRLKLNLFNLKYQLHQN